MTKYVWRIYVRSDYDWVEEDYETQADARESADAIDERAKACGEYIPDNLKIYKVKIESENGYEKTSDITECAE